MKLFAFAAVAVALFCGSAFAADPKPKPGSLEERISILEAKLAALEGKTAPAAFVTATPAVVAVAEGPAAGPVCSGPGCSSAPSAFQQMRSTGPIRKLFGIR